MAPQSKVAVSAGDLVAYEFADDDKWFWSVGRVLLLGHPRLLTLEPWTPQPRTDLGEEERKRIQGMLDDILKKQQDLGTQRNAMQEMKTQIQIKAAAANERREACDAELSEVLPMLEEAKRSVASINMKELREIKGYSQPPPTVRLVMEAVLTIIGMGKKAKDWEFVKQYAVNVQFVPRISAFDPIELTAENAAKTEQIVSNGDFTFERAHRASKAAGPLQRWVEAILAFYRAVPSRLRPVLEESHQLKLEIDELDDQLRTADILTHKVERELRSLHEAKDCIVYGEPVEVCYDREGSTIVTKNSPSGTWVPDPSSKKIHVIRGAVLCALTSLGNGGINIYTFDQQAGERVMSVVNVDGVKLLHHHHHHRHGEKAHHTAGKSQHHRASKQQTVATDQPKTRAPTPPPPAKTKTPKRPPDQGLVSSPIPNSAQPEAQQETAVTTAGIKPTERRRAKEKEKKIAADSGATSKEKDGSKKRTPSSGTSPIPPSQSPTALPVPLKKKGKAKAVAPIEEAPLPTLPTRKQADVSPMTSPRVHHEPPTEGFGSHANPSGSHSVPVTRSPRGVPPLPADSKPNSTQATPRHLAPLPPVSGGERYVPKESVGRLPSLPAMKHVGGGELSGRLRHLPQSTSARP